MRINLRVGNEMGKWLDEQSQKTALSKNAIINVALMEYKQRKEEYEEWLKTHEDEQQGRA